MMQEDTKQTYRVNPGCKFGAGGQLSAGDLVELTPNEAGGFLDKLTLVDDAPQGDANATEDELAQRWDALIELDEAAANIIADTGDMNDPSLNTDAQLLSLDGIGKKRLDKIRSIFPYVHEGEAKS